MSQPMQQQYPQQYGQQYQQQQQPPQQQQHDQQFQHPQLPILVSTMNEVPGYRVARVFGEVFGLTVRSRNAFSNIGASFKAMAGGELRGLTKLLSDSRYEALGRMAQEAMVYGANAVVAARFDCNEIGGAASEIAAYGTAVYVIPDGPPQSSAPSGPQQRPQADGI